MVNVLASTPLQKKTLKECTSSHPQTVQWTRRGRGCFRPQAFPVGFLACGWLGTWNWPTWRVNESSVHLYFFPIGAVTNSHKCSGLKQQIYYFCSSVGQNSNMALTRLTSGCLQNCIFFWSFEGWLIRVVGRIQVFGVARPRPLFPSCVLPRLPHLLQLPSLASPSFLHLQVPQWQAETLSHLESPLPLPLQMSRTGQGSLPSFRSLCRVMWRSRRNTRCQSAARLPGLVGLTAGESLVSSSKAR